jgi:histone-lysine N-methyltransferase SETD3
VLSKLDIQFYSDDHRGIIAKQSIKKDEIFLIIPKDLLISIELAKSTELGQKVSSFMYTELNSPKHCLLSCYILNEKINPKSKWKPYLDILPKDYSNFPIFYNDTELNLLQGSPFKDQIEDKKKDIEKDYYRLCALTPEFQKFSFKDFCEIRMAVSSRIFGVKIDNKKTDVLAPFADMLNHKRPRHTHWTYDEYYKSFIIQAMENIEIGKEVRY